MEGVVLNCLNQVRYIRCYTMIFMIYGKINKFILGS